MGRFKAWAAAYEVELLEIPESDRPRPDYRIIFPDADRTEAIVEVKEIDTPFKKDEQGTIILLPETGHSKEMKSWGEPVRRKIRKAHPQLKQYAREGYPTLLLIGMWTPAIDGVLDYAIPFAMRGGTPQIRFQGEGVPRLVLAGVETGGRQLADNTNTSFSGIGRIVKKNDRSPWRLVVYRHNNPMIAMPGILPGVDYQRDEM